MCVHHTFVVDVAVHRYLWISEIEVLPTNMGSELRNVEIYWHIAVFV
jgi:hypothetical protein